VRVLVFNATFKNILVISRLSVLLVEETGRLVLLFDFSWLALWCLTPLSTLNHKTLKTLQHHTTLEHQRVIGAIVVVIVWQLDLQLPI
jgi:hypothetical protein